MELSSKIVLAILKKIGAPTLIESLGHTLSASELTSLLLEVFHQRTQALTPPKLLEIYQSNRFVKPSMYNPIGMRKLELNILELAQHWNFVPIEISPVTPLGTCSVLAPVHQNKILSAVRNVEVVSDSTNTMALHICSEIKQNSFNQSHKVAPLLKYCNIHQQIRAQKFEKPGLTTHFKTFCMMTAGYDTGSFQFERKNLQEHIEIISTILTQSAILTPIKIRLFQTPGDLNSQNYSEEIWKYLQTSFKDNPHVQILDLTSSNNHYYQGIQFKIYINVNNQDKELADGGFVDWSQRILSNNKERMLLSGFGIQYLLFLLYSN